MYKVMIRDNMSQRAKEILEESGQIEVVVDFDKRTNDPEALAEIIGEFDGLAVRSGTKVKGPALEKADKLKVIGRAGIGVDNIDVAGATQKGIVVMNAPGGNTVTTAEHAVSMMVALARRIPQATASMRTGKWEKKKFMGVEIAGKTLGIIGLGQIGRIVAPRALGLQMKVIGADPYVTKEAASALGVELVELDDLLARADFITLHVPRMEETKNLISKTTLSKMKPGVRIINCARGEVVNIDDLYEALESGHVAGAALDVYPQEPPDPSLPILNHPNVILTPHLGASTGEAQTRVAEMIARQMSDYLLNGVITNAVNFPSVPTEMMENLGPFLSLAERMGFVLGSVVRKPNDINIIYSGYVGDYDTRVLTHAALKGFLDAYTDKPVNYVNAPTKAKEKGINVSETISQQTRDYTNLIRIEMPGLEEPLNEVWGTIFGKKYPRIVRLGAIYVDVIPEGDLLIIEGEDRVGVVGEIGTILSAEGINIAQFHLGRRDGQAICTVTLDSPADEAVLAKIEAVPYILSVRSVRLGPGGA